ncbi:hypothetical protein TcarDRAFT_1288 [Thermosinus carboxydivorans Nor1]|uniref:Virion structural protein n=1 Tax=Thermosinus carboxydivorans Nor1 TaxID=401526 RepID=A1HR56_9FIRM|nr:hypothetical protein [Thermosinus carboxydivorans]EAX47553.1 hypothetical protein TcarDRAFT_1288 [Thermosinus carboxydivorans Nor1]
MQRKTILDPDKGINKYLPKDLIPDTAWSDGNNVLFGVGYVEKAQGWQKFIATQLDGPIMAIDNYYKFNGDSFLMIVTTKRVYYYNPVTNNVVDITGATPLNGTVDNPVFTETAQDLFIITNGIDPIKYWDGVSATIADLPGLTDCVGGVTSVRAKSLVFFQNFLVLFNTIENGNNCPQRLRWSQLGDIQKWKNNADGSGQAGFGDLTDGIDLGQRLVPLGNYLVAYKERSIQVLSYVGGDLIWDKRPAIFGTGLLAPKAIMDLGDEHIFIGPDNIYSFDLIEPKIAGDDIAKEFFRILDPAKAHMTTAFFVEEVPECWFAFVSVNSPNGYHDKAIVYNTDTKAWSIRDMPMTAFGYYNLKDDPIWDTDEGTWDSDDSAWDSSTNLANAPINLGGDAQGYVYVFGGNSKDGADLSFNITSKLFDLDEPFRLKRLKRIQLMVSREGPYNLLVKVGTADNVDEPIKWYGPYNMNLDVTKPPWVDVDITGRYFCVEFSTLKKDEPVRITGYVLYYDIRGVV